MGASKQLQPKETDSLLSSELSSTKNYMKDVKQEEDSVFTKEVCAIILLITLERSAFYGYFLVMIQYLIGMYNLPSDTANIISQTLSSSLSLVSVLGAYVSDSHLGLRNSALYSGSAYVCGLGLTFLASLPIIWKDYPMDSGDFSRVLFFVGMVGIFIGNSSKTVYAVLLTEQANKSGNPLLVERVYRLYTFALNAGPTLSMLLVPSLHNFGPLKLIGETYKGTSFYLCFGTSFLLMMVGVLCFAYNSANLHNAGKPDGSSNPILRIFKTVRNGMANKRKYSLITSNPRLTKEDLEIQRSFSHRDHSDSFLSFCDEEHQGVAMDIFKTWHLYVMFLILLPPYMMAYQQCSTTFVIQANWMSSPSWLAPESMAFLNALFSILASPVIDVSLTFLQHRGIFFGPHLRIAFSYIIMSMCFLYMAYVQALIATNGKESLDGTFQSSVSVMYQIFGQFLSGFSSVLCTASCLEYAYNIAPAYMKTLVVSLFNISLAFGSFMGVLVSPWVTADKMYYMYSTVGWGLLVLSWMYYSCFKSYDQSYLDRNMDVMKDAKGQETEVVENEQLFEK
eukprot:Nk52_evm2s302 gene=Nk52_evmTU2s302